MNLRLSLSMRHFIGSTVFRFPVSATKCSLKRSKSNHMVPAQIKLELIISKARSMSIFSFDTLPGLKGIGNAGFDAETILANQHSSTSTNIVGSWRDFWMIEHLFGWKTIGKRFSDADESQVPHSFAVGPKISVPCLPSKQVDGPASQAWSPDLTKEYLRVLSHSPPKLWGPNIGSCYNRMT